MARLNRPLTDIEKRKAAQQKKDRAARAESGGKKRDTRPNRGTRKKPGKVSGESSHRGPSTNSGSGYLNPRAAMELRRRQGVR